MLFAVGDRQSGDFRQRLLPLRNAWRWSTYVCFRSVIFCHSPHGACHAPPPRRLISGNSLGLESPYGSYAATCSWPA